MKVYLAAPWRRQEQMREVAGEIAALGHSVISTWPYEEGGTTLGTPENAAKDLRELGEAQVVVIFPEHFVGGGMNVETGYAMARGIPILQVGGMTNTFHHLIPETQRFEDWPAARAYLATMATPTILQEAQRLVYGDRERTYGHPREDFGRMAGMLNALFARKLKEPFEARDVPMIWILQKLGRHANLSKRDNVIDMAGYAEVLARVEGMDP